MITLAASFFETRGFAKIVIFVGCAVIFGIAAGLGKLFPRQRWKMSITLMASGMLELLGAAALNFMRDDDSLGPLMIFLFIAGFASAIVGYAMFKQLNSEN